VFLGQLIKAGTGPGCSAPRGFMDGKGSLRNAQDLDNSIMREYIQEGMDHTV